MDIFLRNIPGSASEGQLKCFFKQKLQLMDCYAFELAKFKNGGCGILTLPTTDVAARFLTRYGLPQTHQRGARPQCPLIVSSQTIYCSVSKSKPDKILVQCLQKENIQFGKGSKKKKENFSNTKAEVTTFQIASLDCGLWECRDASSFYFQSTYRDARQGSIHLGRRSLVVLLNPDTLGGDRARIDVGYSVVQSVALGNASKPSITLTLAEAPTFSRSKIGTEDLTAGLQDLVLMGRTRPSPDRRVRTPSLSPSHAAAAGACLVYRITFPTHQPLELIKRHLKQCPGSPPFLTWPTPMRAPDISFHEQFQGLVDELGRSSGLSFKIKFQLQRLASNGFLSPGTVRRLVGSIRSFSADHTEAALVTAFQTVSRNLPYAGPDVRPDHLSVQTVLNAIIAAAREFRYFGSVFDQADRHAHLGLVHKVLVTPAGLYLQGPDLETKNRVIRKYTRELDHFVRVSFTDENFENLAFYPSPQEIYRGKFREAVEKTIVIAGRGYKFLGFSNSSLRSRQCWFMAPFVVDGSLLHAPQVIQRLGDFSKIFSPAKCAARIGQAFSDTTHTITITNENWRSIPDIERNGRTFSDGCGSISNRLLRQVWKEFSKTNKAKATVIQIRFQGAKGVLSLDTRLSACELLIRPSMDKFPAKGELDLEICGAAYKPLSCYLNRQFIKLLEDLEVPAEAFLDLQAEAVDKLKATLESASNAARFMEIERFGTSARVPSLIRHLRDLGVDFRHDRFLRNLIEMMAVTRMREIKYRGRIPLENAFLLYGVVDDTGFVPENHVYVTIRERGEREVLTGQLIVTRAPALYPGDIQLATAVDVPNDSPLAHLHNCIVFSQHGPRDLPSMLSGGDLDGDLFNVIFEPSLWPKKTFPPADYPRMPPIDIGHPVTAPDMMDFLINFFESDQLGYISNCHLQLADQARDGTLDKRCIALAGMASTAVDFAKTGIPVDMSEMPRFAKRCKPDYMAPAARLLMDVKSSFQVAAADIEEDDHEDDGDAVSALDPDARRTRYYQSQKVLGHLYRQIDEGQFLHDLRDMAPTTKMATTKSIMSRILEHIKVQMQSFAYEHHLPLAREIRETYYWNLVDTAFEFSPDLRKPLTELEVFAGTILGRDGGIATKRVRESNISMRERISRNVSFTIEHILKGNAEQIDSYPDEEEEVSFDEALERSVACLVVSVEEPVEHIERFGTPCSFKYVALAICLEQLKRRFNRLRPLN